VTKPAARRSARPPRSRKSRPRSKGTPVRRGLIRVLLVVSVLLGSPVLALSIWAGIGHSEPGKVTLVSLNPGTSMDEAVSRLSQLGLIHHPWLLQIYAGTLGRGVSVEPGEHLLDDSLSPRELLQRLGRLAGRPTVHVTVPEGFDHVRLAQRLADKQVCSRQGFIAAVRDPSILSRLGIGGGSAEGYLFPATYELFVDSDPARLVQRFAEETRSRLQKTAQSLEPSILRSLEERRGWGEAEILTLASMIEKEAVVDDERPIVASVFLNRLDDPTFRPVRMLQSDPTAAYGCLVSEPRLASCGEGELRAPPAVTPRMLRDADNPYNTYQHPGLPPGPIASPGEASLRAVLQPSQTKYLFFVAIGGGRHRFSTTFQEHRDAIRSADPTR
jgi:UPF0755 protein